MTKDQSSRADRFTTVDSATYRHSTITATPLGWIASAMASAICRVNRSCTRIETQEEVTTAGFSSSQNKPCRRRLKTSTILCENKSFAKRNNWTFTDLAILLKPSTRLLGKYPTDTLPKKGTLKKDTLCVSDRKWWGKRTCDAHRANTCRFLWPQPYFHNLRQIWHH